MERSYFATLLLASVVLLIGASGCSSDSKQNGVLQGKIIDQPQEQSSNVESNLPSSYKPPINARLSYMDQQNQIYEEFGSLYRNLTLDLEGLNNKEITEQEYLEASRETLREYKKLKERVFLLNSPEEYFPFHERVLRAYTLEILSMQYDIGAHEAIISDDLDEALSLHDKSTSYAEQAQMEWDSASAALKARPKEKASTSSCTCDYNTYDCADFNSRASAQSCFEKCGGVNNDVHHLDADGDGLACEWNN